MDKKSAGEPIPISTQKSLSSSHDSGWNDPPKWAYSQSPNSSTTPTKRVLNKRVAFPLGSTPPTSNFDPYQPLAPPPANMPPPPLTAARLDNSQTETAKLENSEEDGESFVGVSKEQAILDCLDNFKSVINENEELESKRDDITRRLNLMKTAWTEDKLDENIRRKVLELSNALKTKDIETADKIHVSLMMEHAALCSSWIPAIRQMILSLRAKREQEDRPVEEMSQSPYLLPCTDLRET